MSLWEVPNASHPFVHLPQTDSRWVTPLHCSKDPNNNPLFHHPQQHSTITNPPSQTTPQEDPRWTTPSDHPSATVPLYDSRWAVPAAQPHNDCVVTTDTGIRRQRISDLAVEADLSLEVIPQGRFWKEEDAASDYSEGSQSDPVEDEALVDEDTTDLKKIRRQHLTRLLWLYEVEGLDEADDDDWVVFEAMHSIKAATFNQYCSHYRKLRRENLAISTAGLLLYLRRYHRRAPNSSKHMVSAVRFYEECYGVHGESVQLNRVTTGLTKYAKKTVRGGITNEKLNEILGLSDSVVPREYKDFFILLQATGVRGNQLARIRMTDVREKKGSPGVYYVVCPANHKGRCSTLRGHYEAHETRPEWGAELARIIQQRRNNNSLLLAPKWSSTKGNKYIKSAATLLNWTSKLVWVVHSLRHGAAIEAFRVGDSLGEKMINVQKMTHHRGAGMIRHYGGDNDLRELIVGVMQETRARLGPNHHVEKDRAVYAAVKRAATGGRGTEIDGQDLSRLLRENQNRMAKQGEAFHVNSGAVK